MGIFIVFEGIDGSGKSTQIKRTAEWLKTKTDRPIVVTKEPGGTKTGIEIRRLLLESKLDTTTQLLLFAADRRQHIVEIIRPALDSGAIVLSDRFCTSTFAYQGWGDTSRNMARITFLNQMVCDGVKPDITFLLDILVATALDRLSSRSHKDIIEIRNTPYLEKVREGYLKESKKVGFAGGFSVIDGSKPINQVSQDIQRILLGAGII